MTIQDEVLSLSKDEVFVDAKILRDYMRDVFIGLNVKKKDAEVIADVLISADLRGVDSHGIQRCKMYYDRIKAGIYNTKTHFNIVKEGPTTAVIDGENGLGPVIAYKSMKLAIKKAKKYGLGAVAVRNSTHFGIAGYYSLMAIKEGMIGITTTNARPAIPPTFGVEPMLGTNPLTSGAPTDEGMPFLLDCATSIIQRGKVEVYNRTNRLLPEDVVITFDGNTETNPDDILKDLVNNNAALLPLGGKGESGSGYKGYGYATLVEILSSALQNGVFLKDTAGVVEDGQMRLKVGHFFLAINIESFTPLSAFKKTTGSIMRNLRNSKKAPGKDRIYTAGEKEHYTTLERIKTGIPLNKSLQADIKTMQNELDLSKYSFPF
ncbi:MAG: Ldh family oxidoreductase [Candidatus Lokiarchaeota archaeon]|nr:Ldh family oxidoreductase [Candidatus Lokiarchaeota archaeon]